MSTKPTEFLVKFSPPDYDQICAVLQSGGFNHSRYRSAIHEYFEVRPRPFLECLDLLAC